MPRNGALGRRGASALGCLVPLLALSILGYFAAHASDAAFRYYRFRDAMQQEARFAHRPRRTDERIRERLLALADSQAIPVRPADLQVRRTESGIRISANYSEEIDFLLFSRRFDFFPQAERRF